MANKAISELPQAQNVNNQDLFVLEQSGIAKKLTAETFITEQGIVDALAEALDGHGGIQSVTLSSVSGRIRTYLITFTDQSATTFQVYDGTSIDRITKTSTAGLTDTYTVFMNDGSTTFFTVTNGADGTVSEAMLNDALKDKAPAITETVTGAIANFPDGADDIPVADLVVNIEPVQSGSGDPSPDNVRPITGWTGANVTRCGKNLLPFPHSSGTTQINGVTYTVNNDGSVYMNGTATGAASYFNLYGNPSTPIPSWFKPSTTYFWHVPTKPSKYFTQLILYGSTAWTKVGGSSVTTPADFSQYTGFAVVIGVYNGASVDDTIYPMLELGSTATDYEPYQGTSVAVSWQTEAGTVYGGSLDVATGLLTVTHALITLDGSQTIGDNGSMSYGGRQVSYTPLPEKAYGYPSNTSDLLSNIFSTTHLSAEPFYISGRTTNGKIYLNMPETVTTLQQAKDWFSANNTQVWYKLATPQTYQLTPQEVRTLLGTNNIFSDCSSVEVEYRADTKLYIEKLTMPTEDDLVANSAISSGSFFMIGNTLYRATTAIASGATITVGTNATRLSLADALNAINT